MAVLGKIVKYDQVAALFHSIETSKSVTSRLRMLTIFHPPCVSIYDLNIYVIRECLDLSEIVFEHD